MGQKISTKENQRGNSIENLVDVPPATTLPYEILEIIFADCFEPFLLEDQFIREQIILKFYKEFYIQEPIESVFVRQKRIYQSASSLLTLCRTFYAALRNSNVFWQKIFHLTLGARSWLLNTPSVIQTKFNGSYYQACQYLMTFGEKLDFLKLNQLHPELTFVGIGTSFILFQNDANEYLRYDLSTRALVPLSSITQTGVNSVHDKYLIIEGGFLFNLSIYIYDLLEDRLLQQYENVTEELQGSGMITTYKFVHYGDWLAYRFFVRSTREGEPYHMMFGISEDVVKKQKQFDYLLIKDDHTHRLWFKHSRAEVSDILYRCVIKANRTFESVLDHYEERNPFTDAPLSQLPMKRAKLLGNFALALREDGLIALTTSVKRAVNSWESPSLGFPPKKYTIRGTELFIVNEGKCYVAQLY